jgi:hypothetical protein
MAGGKVAEGGHRAITIVSRAVAGAFQASRKRAQSLSDLMSCGLPSLVAH